MYKVRRHFFKITIIRKHKLYDHTTHDSIFYGRKRTQGVIFNDLSVFQVVQKRICTLQSPKSELSE